MLTTAKIVAFSATLDPARALTFYRDVLGLRLVADEPFAIAFDAGGTMLRLQNARVHTPAQHTLLGWDVPDIRAMIRSLADRGVTFVRYDWMPADADNVWTAPGGTMIAWFKDPDDNVLSLTQFQ